MTGAHREDWYPEKYESNGYGLVYNLRSAFKYYLNGLNVWFMTFQ